MLCKTCSGTGSPLFSSIEEARKAQEAKWRLDIWGVIENLIAPCQEALRYGNLDRLDHRRKRNCLVRLKDKVQLAEEWALNEALDIPDDGTCWSRSHPNMLGVKIVSLYDREERLEWVKEKVPFALKAHEDYYHALDNYPALYQIEDTLPFLRRYVFDSLPAYANNDIFLNREYERLNILVEAYLEKGAGK